MEDGSTLPGWVKLYRKTINSRVFANPEILRLFLWLLFHASLDRRHVKLRTGLIVTINRAELFVAQRQLAEQLEVSPSSLRRWLAKLVEWETIEMETRPGFTRIRIVNFDHYQASEAAHPSEAVSPGKRRAKRNAPAKGGASAAHSRRSTKKDKKYKNCLVDHENVLCLRMERVKALHYSADKFQAVFAPSTSELLLRVAALRLSGAVSEAFVDDALQAVKLRARPPRSPGGFLRTVWRNSRHLPDGADGDWFDRAIDSVEWIDDAKK